MKEFFEIFNIRFLNLVVIGFLPLWACLISGIVVLAAKKLGVLDDED